MSGGPASSSSSESSMIGEFLSSGSGAPTCRRCEGIRHLLSDNEPISGPSARFVKAPVRVIFPRCRSGRNPRYPSVAPVELHCIVLDELERVHEAGIAAVSVEEAVEHAHLRVVAAARGH